MRQAYDYWQDQPDSYSLLTKHPPDHTESGHDLQYQSSSSSSSSGSKGWADGTLLPSFLRVLTSVDAHHEHPDYRCLASVIAKYPTNIADLNQLPANLTNLPRRLNDKHRQHARKQAGTTPEQWRSLTIACKPGSVSLSPHLLHPPSGGSRVNVF